MGRCEFRVPLAAMLAALRATSSVRHVALVPSLTSRAVPVLALPRGFSTEHDVSDAPMVAESRPYPAWLDAIFNREHATGPRRNRFTKRMKQRDRQRVMNHKQRQRETAAAKERRFEKRREAWAAATEYKEKWSAVMEARAKQNEA